MELLILLLGYETLLVVGIYNGIDWRSREASAFGSADLEVKAATLEAARAELERQREVRFDESES